LKKKVLINGINSKVAGGKSILINLTETLKTSKHSYQFLIYFPSNFIYDNNDDDKIVSKQKCKFIPSYFYYFFIFHFICKIKRVSFILNLGDVPICSTKKQIFLFDWAYAVYPESEVWSLLSIYERVYKKIKIFLFKIFLNRIDVFLAQTKIIKKRLMSQFKIASDIIYIFPNSYSTDYLKNISNNDFPGIQLENYNFLVLSNYYPHKNLEILIDVAKKIKINKLPFRFILTVNETKSTLPYLKKIKINNLDDIIINIGTVLKSDVPNLYNKCSALLLPTLLESFSGTFIESMFCNKPIFTSNYDFAFDVCKDAAIYFDPHDSNDILDKMYLILNDNYISNKLAFYPYILNNLPSWSELCKILLGVIKKLEDD